MKDKPSDLTLALDAYAPGEIAKRVETAGVAKVKLSMLQTLALAVLAGAFISFGAMLYTLAMTGADFALGIDRLIGGLAFSLGLVLVVVAGAELFTGNNLIVIAWSDRLISSADLARNWILVYIGNFIGAIGMVFLALFAGLPEIGQGAMGKTALAIANAKVDLPFYRAFFSGILCNILVCLAVWMCFSARRVAGKILCVIFPVCAFVALGFEHSIANMYLIPVGLLAENGPADLGTQLGGFLGNLVPVTLGNIVGGGVLVSAVYWVIYRRAAKPSL